jgi:hypothetical protein
MVAIFSWMGGYPGREQDIRSQNFTPLNTWLAYSAPKNQGQYLPLENQFSAYNQASRS